jgi:hypothetical protein
MAACSGMAPGGVEPALPASSPRVVSRTRLAPCATFSRIASAARSSNPSSAWTSLRFACVVEDYDPSSAETSPPSLIRK